MPLAVIPPHDVGGQICDAVEIVALVGAGFHLLAPALGRAQRDDHADLYAVSVVATDELVQLAQLRRQVEFTQVDARRRSGRTSVARYICIQMDARVGVQSLDDIDVGFRVHSQPLALTDEGARGG
jgi:hypothetical protein